jgi:hypothetical protein
MQMENFQFCKSEWHTSICIERASSKKIINPKLFTNDELVELILKAEELNESSYKYAIY